MEMKHVIRVTESDEAECRIGVNRNGDYMVDWSKENEGDEFIYPDNEQGGKDAMKKFNEVSKMIMVREMFNYNEGENRE